MNTAASDLKNPLGIDLQANSHSSTQIHWHFRLFSFVVVVLAYRLSILILQDIPLYYDEAYYHYWSLTPDWGYFSKPPVVAWLITLSSWLGGHHAWVTKVSAPILYALSSLIVGATARRLYGDRVGFWSGVYFMLMPIVSFNSLFITTDAPLLFFWALAFYAFVRALQTGTWGSWTLAGISCGLGMLSKYTMIVLPGSAVLFLLVSQNYRHYLYSGKLWWAVLLTVALFTPNLYWNYQHDFISFQHTRDISHLQRSLFHFNHFLEFFGGQFIVFGPIAMGLFVFYAVRRSSYNDLDWRLMLMASLPFILAMSIQSFLARAQVNWAAPTYVAATIWVVHYLLKKGKEKWLVGALVINVLLMFSLYHYHGLLKLVDVEPSEHNDPYHRVLGWPEMGQQLSPWREKYPKAILLSDSRDLLAYFGYYTEPSFGSHVAAWNPRDNIDNHYELIANVDQYPNSTFLFVSKSPLNDSIKSRFEKAEFLATIRTQVYTDFERVVTLYYLEGFKGYETNSTQ